MVDKPGYFASCAGLVASIGFAQQIEVRFCSMEIAGPAASPEEDAWATSCPRDQSGSRAPSLFFA
jgi:hypothetical protein